MSLPGRRRRWQPSTIVTLALLLALTSGVSSAQDPASADPLYQRLDAGERVTASELVQAALETVLSQRTRSWRNAASGRSGSVTPLRTFKTVEGVYCRQYRELIAAADRVAEAMRIACRDGEGRWQVVER